MSRTKYSYELKYRTICEVLKGKTISQVVEEFHLPYGGALLRHWLMRYKHPDVLLETQDFENEAQYQKQLETRENDQINLFKKEVKELTKIKQNLGQELQTCQKIIGQLKFKLYQQENLKTANLELKHEQRKLLNLITKLTRENKKYQDQIATEKLKKKVIANSRSLILGSGSKNE